MKSVKKLSSVLNNYLSWRWALEEPALPPRLKPNSTFFSDNTKKPTTVLTPYPRETGLGWDPGVFTMVQNY
jgi:hypothetical protein